MAAREAYLATGPFPALTATTITDPAALREQLRQVRDQGFARDDGEIAEGLSCLAVPIHHFGSSAVAAISVSRSGLAGQRTPEDEVVDQLRRAAGEIEAAIPAA